MKELYYYIRYIFAVPVLIIDIVFESLFLIIMFTLFSAKFNFGSYYNNWGRRVLAIAGIKLKIIGYENVPPGKSYIFASNHVSQFDIPIIFAAIKSKISIIYKKELEKVPFFGWKLNSSYFIAIDRSDARKAMASVIEAIKQLKKGVSIFIYPEGTRSDTGEVQEFKRGTFILAEKSGKSIVPMTIVGSDKILPKGKLFFRPGRVAVVFHPPYSFPEKMSKSEEQEHLEKIRQIIISGFDIAKKHLANS